MNPAASRKYKVPPRIELTDQIENRFKESVFNRNVTDLVKRTRLPYMLVYNVVHRRVKSVSQRNYRILFREDPAPQSSSKVDGTLFRNMVRLWRYLNGDQSIAELYQTLFPEKQGKKPDYRIFSGRVKTVDIAVEQVMLLKFQAQGLDPATVERWIDEMNATPHQERIAYRRVRPLLLFLRENLGIHPNVILNQLFDRYERGELQSVPSHIYERARALRQKAEIALGSGTRLALERIKEDIYGPKTGYTLYEEVAEELNFLRKYARKSMKKYLGRSMAVYDKGLCKRLPSPKAAAIRNDCAAFIRQHPEIALTALPPRYRRQWAMPLLGVLINRATDLMLQDKGGEFEKRILAPGSSREDYKNAAYGFTRFDLASRVLGMRKKAFDLMVAKNCHIFREVGRFDRHWYLSDLYLKELSQNPDFPLLTAKYELLSHRLKGGGAENTCMN